VNQFKKILLLFVVLYIPNSLSHLYAEDIPTVVTVPSQPAAAVTSSSNPGTNASVSSPVTTTQTTSSIVSSSPTANPSASINTHLESAFWDTLIKVTPTVSPTLLPIAIPTPKGQTGTDKRHKNETQSTPTQENTPPVIPYTHLPTQKNYDDLANTIENKLNLENLSLQKRSVASQQTILSGTEDFLEERFREEISIYFLREVRKYFLRPELQISVLFPNLYVLFNKWDGVSWPAGSVWQAAFAKDSQDLTFNSFNFIVSLADKYPDIKNELDPDYESQKNLDNKEGPFIQDCIGGFWVFSCISNGVNAHKRLLDILDDLHSGLVRSGRDGLLGRSKFGLLISVLYNYSNTLKNIQDAYSPLEIALNKSSPNLLQDATLASQVENLNILLQHDRSSMQAGDKAAIRAVEYAQIEKLYSVVTAPASTTTLQTLEDVEKIHDIAVSLNGNDAWVKGNDDCISGWVSPDQLEFLFQNGALDNYVNDLVAKVQPNIQLETKNGIDWKPIQSELFYIQFTNDLNSADQAYLKIGQEIEANQKLDSTDDSIQQQFQNKLGTLNSKYYQAVLKVVLDVLQLDQNFEPIQKEFPDKNEVSITSFVNDVSDIYAFESQGNYGAALEKVEEILSGIFGDEKSPKGSLKLVQIIDKDLEPMLKYGNFIATVATAQNPNDVKQAIENIAAPAGEVFIKRNSSFNLLVNGYMGFGSSESIKFDQEPQFTLNTPVGIEASWGNFIFSDFSAGLLFSFADLGALLNEGINNNADILSTQNIKEVFSPGMFVMLGLPNLPLSLGFGAEFNPATENQVAQTRLLGFTGVDLPLFELQHGSNDAIPVGHRYTSLSVKSYFGTGFIRSGDVIPENHFAISNPWGIEGSLGMDKWSLGLFVSAIDFTGLQETAFYENQDDFNNNNFARILEPGVFVTLGFPSNPGLSLGFGTQDNVVNNHWNAECFFDVDLFEIPLLSSEPKSN